MDKPNAPHGPGDAAGGAGRLRELLGPSVRLDAGTRALYSSDASNYRVPPVAVVRAESAAHAVDTVAHCHRLGLSVVARGAGTSVAGNAIGPGVVLDLTALDAVAEIDPERRTATVGAGTVQARLQREAAPHGLLLGPDPSTADRCTIGGMIGNNACGAHAVAWGNTRDNVVSARLLLADGRQVTADQHGTSDAELNTRLRQTADAHLAVLRTEYGRFPRQASGYALDALLPERGFDVMSSLVGSEGTLALVLDATVRLVPAPAARALAVLGFPDMPSAADATPALVALGPLAVEGMDRRLVEVVVRRKGAAAVPALPRGAGWLLVETGGASLAEAEHAARAVLAASGAVDGQVVTDPGRIAALWRIRTDGVGLAGRTPGGADAWPGWEDAAVPPERLGAYLRDLDALLGQHHYDGLLYGHFGDGCVHGRFDFGLRDEGGAARMRAFLEDAADLVAAHGGSMSGEHGDGRARGELLARMYSPAALGAAAAVKAVWDPGALLNPGVLVDPAPLDADLRVRPQLPVVTGAFAYPHDSGDLTRAVHRCVGVGKCRADLTTSGGAMCPSYLATGEERHSTRGRARLLQEMIRGDLVDGGWADPAVHEALDLCLSCKACSSDCPAGVDMATYKAEVLHQRYRRRLRPVTHYSLGWLPRTAGLATRLAGVSNALLGNRWVGALVKRLGGIDGRRGLPRFARRTFRASFRADRDARDARADREARGPRPSRPRVLLWVDSFTQSFSPEVGTAAVRVLERAGYAVELTGRQVCCGLTWISTGQLDGARRQLRRTYTALEPAVADGVPIVGLEPSCTSVLRRDGVELLPDDPRARRVADLTVTLAELLSRTPGWSPPDLSGVRTVAQPHCHQRAVMGWRADEELLRTAGADVTAVGGCCGLAGNFGVERGHYDVSVAVARTALLPALETAERTGPVLADGFSCRTQIDDLAAGAGAVHLAQLLASALDESDGRAVKDGDDG
ncbi:FAD-binding and (Fe-S)-binding domain-containing protein [Streptomyces sp. NPDC093221]|uniref:FAD-binding and (Fe-S)-binding domain-containing protein n=1 Tax=Streptomyces sp. NPDC093221 TaxID=3366032 RepID=UPI003818351C